MPRKPLLYFLLFILLPNPLYAGIFINEVMYDLSGSDTDGEWVEVWNDSDADVDITGYKFFDGANHVLNAPPKNDGRGALLVPANSGVIFASNTGIFLSQNPGVSGSVIDTAMALSNTSATLKVLDPEGVEIDSFSYSKELGGAGDGNSLQKIDAVWKSASPTPNALNADSPNVDEDEDGAGRDNETNNVSTSSSDFPVLPQIFAEIKAPAIAMAGADAFFLGEAYGLKKEPIENARFLWNFGDGAYKDGQNISHIFVYPGEYVVFLSVASGKYSASDRTTIKIIPPEIKIKQILLGDKPGIILSNTSKYELDISYWRLRQGSLIFSLPKNTFILTGKEITLSSAITGIYPNEGLAIELMYPNGEIAGSFNHSPDISAVENVVQNNNSVIESLPGPQIISFSQEIQDEDEVLDASDKDIFFENTATQESLAGASFSEIQNSSGGFLKWLVFLFGIISVASFLTIVLRRESGVVLALNDENPNLDVGRPNSESGLPLAEDFEIIDDELL